jgi:hypothetical protein
LATFMSWFCPPFWWRDSNILCNVWVLDHFWPPVVPCYGTWDAAQIVNSFITISTTRNYNHLQSFITLCHIYTAYNLTCQYSILSVIVFITHFK